MRQEKISLELIKYLVRLQSQINLVRELDTCPGPTMPLKDSRKASVLNINMALQMKNLVIWQQQQ